MQGISGTFAINGVSILIPTEHDWVGTKLLGTSGNGNPTYPSVREYELQYKLISMEDFNQLYSAYLVCQASGSCVVDLPKYRTTPYQFYSYSGCVIQEPVTGKYFQEYMQDVVLKIVRVRV